MLSGQNRDKVAAVKSRPSLVETRLLPGERIRELARSK
jgi:hypothetical protein